MITLCSGWPDPPGSLRRVFSFGSTPVMSAVPFRRRFLRTSTVMVLPLLALTACQSNGSTPRNPNLPPLQERTIASLEKPPETHVIPEQETGPAYNPDLPFLILYKNKQNVITGIWQGGVMMNDRSAQACYEAIQRKRSAGVPVQVTKLPNICKYADVKIRDEK